MADFPVLCVIVATNAGAWLRDTIAGLKAQTHPTIDVIVVDNASTDRSRQILDKAFGKDNVVRLERRVGYARALGAGLKAAGDRAAAAKAFLILHDDCAMEPGVVEALVDTLGYENVGVAGPKLVDWTDPQILQEVGLSVDRYARIFDPLERQELDQGQYDKVREVMWVTSTCMLVSAEVVKRAGFFDARFVAFREDLDLCWRARLAGFKVAYCGTARARHVAASARDIRQGWSKGRVRYFVERNLLASLIKNYSARRLIVALPAAIILGLGNAILYALTGRRSEAGQILEGLRWNVAHLPSTIRARTRAQRARTESDQDVMRLAMKGAHRLRSLFELGSERIFGTPAAGLEEAEGLATPGETVKLRLRDRVRAHPTGTAVIAIVVLALIGARELFTAQPIAGADMPPMPANAGALFESFFSGWRTAETGSAAAAPTAGFFAGVLSLITFASPRLAQRVLLFGLPLLAAATAARLASVAGCGKAARRVAGFAYALSPLTLWALGEGRLSDLVLLAAAPGLCVPLVRAAGLAPWNGWRSLLAPVIGVTVVAAFSPWVVVFTLGSGVVLALGVAASGGHAKRALRTAASGAIMSVSAAVFLFPWSLEWFKAGSPLGLGGALPHIGAENLARLSPGAVRPVPLLIAAGLPLVAIVGYVFSGKQRSFAARMFAIAAVAGLAFAFAVDRGIGFIAPRASLPLALCAVGLAVLIGLGVEGVAGLLRGRQFGLAQLGLVASTVVLIVSIGAGGLWYVRGVRPGIGPSGQLAPAFLAADRDAYGDFRVLWLSGDTRHVQTALTGATGDDFRTYAERRAGAARDALDRIIAGVAAGTVDAAGRQLAPFGVRYIFLRPGSVPALREAFGRQSDLRFVQRFEGSAVYANDAALPVAVSVSAPGWALASRADASVTAAAIAGAEANAQRGDGFSRRTPGLLTGSVREGAKRVLFGSSFDARWELVLRDTGQRAPAERSFGWATGFAAAGTGRATLVWNGQRRYVFALLVQIVILLFAAGAISRRVARERGEL